jgi:ATP-binding cassette subfamily A (ABC1) protein 3
LGVGVGAFIVLFLMEFRIFEILYYYCRMIYRATFGILCKNFLQKPPVPDNSADTDVDVKYEKERINAMMPADFLNYNLVMKNVSRYYKDFLAVNQLCIGIKHSECFGLLG